MNDMQPELNFDSRTRVVLRDTEQAAQIERVSHRIRGAILDFCRRRAGQEFHVETLRAYVEEVVGHCAPGSPDRILRMLRQRGQLDYQVVNRAQSLYRLAGARL